MGKRHSEIMEKGYMKKVHGLWNTVLRSEQESQVDSYMAKTMADPKKLTDLEANELKRKGFSVNGGYVTNIPL